MKSLKIIIFSFILVLLLSQNVFAIGEIFSTADDFKATSQNYVNITMDTTQLQDTSGKIFNVLLATATGVAVVVGAIMAVKFMTAGVDRKVEVKESLFPYLVSCIVVFGSLGIWKLVVLLLNNLS